MQVIFSVTQPWAINLQRQKIFSANIANVAKYSWSISQPINILSGRRLLNVSFDILVDKLFSTLKSS